LTGTITSYDEAFTKIDESSKKMDPETLAARAARMADDGSKRTAEAIKQAQADQLAALTVSRTTAETVAQSNALIVSAIAEANKAQQQLYKETLDGTTSSLKSFNEKMPELIRRFVVPYFQQSLEAVGAFVKGSSSTLSPPAKPAGGTPAGATQPVAAPPSQNTPVVPPVPGQPAAPVALPAAAVPPPPVPGPAGTGAGSTAAATSAEPEAAVASVNGTLNVNVRFDQSGLPVADVEATGFPSGMTVLTTERPIA
jgi:hypothetical protein